MPSRIAASRTLRLFTAALFLALPNASSGHDIPNDVTVQMFVQPAGDRRRQGAAGVRRLGARVLSGLQERAPELPAELAG